MASASGHIAKMGISASTQRTGWPGHFTDDGGRMRQLAPWLDYKGHSVYEGDRIVEHSGDSGIVVFRAGRPSVEECWRVDYGYGNVRSLRAELGEAGKAIVIDETGKDL